MRPEVVAGLSLPVARTADLGHLTPAHTAAALGNDPSQIFAFVRDAIGYEAYSGFMRGPRGTLLALSGNSVDRAALLASLLEHAGHQVRFVRGRLPEREARELLGAMWAEPPVSANNPSPRADDPAERGLVDTLQDAVRRDYDLLTEHFRKARRPEARAAVEPAQSLEEARDHYWIQYSKAGQWVDLDPLFADAAPGRTSTKGEEILDRLPDALSHRVTVRVRLEEYSGENPSTRDLLVHTVRVADVTGDDLLLVHLPEDWSEASGSDSTESTTAPISSIKPVLIVGTQIIVGQSFRIGSGEPGERVRDILSGEGSRRPAAPVPTAEWVEFELLSPGGRETVTRELFDVVGKARRMAGRNLASDEIQAQMARVRDVEIESTVYGVLVSAGSIHWRHIIGVEEESAQPADTLDVSQVLSRLTHGFTALADTLVGRLKTAKGTLRFYPATPRIVIAEISVSSARAGAGLDLRHPLRRAAVRGATQDEARAGQRFRGVVEGAIERVLIELLTQQVQGGQERPTVMSTSTVLERAAAEGVPIEILTGEAGRPGAEVPEDARARLHEDISRGFLTVGPIRPIVLAGKPRFAWWRIDPQSGQTIGVTDEGLHQTSTEQPGTTGGPAKTQTRIIVQRDLRGPNPHVSVTIRQRHIPTGQVETTSFTQGLEAGTRSLGRVVQRLTSDPTQAVRVFENTILGP